MNAPDLTPLSPLLYMALVQAALAEDLGRAGDITSDSIIPETATVRVTLRTRQAGRLAGIDIAEAVFRQVDPRLQVEKFFRDGDALSPDNVIATIAGPARGVLTAERTALNFLGHLSGVATATARMAAAAAGHKARICCTRKTIPGLRALQKYAVRAGGGANHRFGLDDAVLIKDNHIGVAGGVRQAIARARAHAGHMVKIEVEVDTLAQLAEALLEKPDIILLDNMPPDMLREAVRITAGRVILEASGNVNLTTVAAIAATGVDLISVGALTHSSACLDLGLDFDWAG
ncbi:MAG: carboxylating nicotinate-nucleotide diphosphorylase [Alphaproteobacteria bacterium]|nr:carboxylating nicotinate-nucleotide diphosphorylase [Alphaproteobacteria bacterium]